MRQHVGCVRLSVALEIVRTGDHDARERRERARDDRGAVADAGAATDGNVYALPDQIHQSIFEAHLDA